MNEDSLTWRSAARKLNERYPKNTGGIPYQSAREADAKRLRDYLVFSYQGGLNISQKNTHGDQLLHCTLDPRGFPDMPRTPENDLARLQTVEFLLGMGADVNAPNSQNETPLQLAVVGGNDAVIRKLLKAGAAVNGVYPPGMHPVQLSVATGNVAITGMLLDAGADINLENSWPTSWSKESK